MRTAGRTGEVCGSKRRRDAVEGGGVMVVLGGGGKGGGGGGKTTQVTRLTSSGSGRSGENTK